MTPPDPTTEAGPAETALTPATTSLAPAFAGLAPDLALALTVTDGQYSDLSDYQRQQLTPYQRWVLLNHPPDPAELPTHHHHHDIGYDLDIGF